MIEDNGGHFLVEADALAIIVVGMGHGEDEVRNGS